MTCRPRVSDITDLCAKNDMMPCVSLMSSADIAQLDDFYTRHQRSCCPFGQLVGVVLQLCGQNSSSLGFKLMSPVHTCAKK